MNSKYGYRLRGAIDTQTLDITDLGGLPDVPEPHSSITFWVMGMTVTYERDVPDTAWHLAKIEARGMRVRKNGAATGIDVTATWVDPAGPRERTAADIALQVALDAIGNAPARTSEPHVRAPQCLLDIAEVFRPRAVATAAMGPDSPGAEVFGDDPDLDT